jgi:thiol-disulfide isomerase/thioredoxin
MIVAVISAAIVIAALVAAIVVLTGDSADRPDDLAFNGTALPAYVGGETDPAIGAKAPLFTTEYLDGSYAFVGGGGGPNDTAKLVVFVAHWCPVCQAELPEISDWVARNGLPDGVEIVMVSTFQDPDRDNHPPADWFDDVGWEAPVAIDSQDGEIITTWFGMPSVPSWVLLTDLNFVLGRGTGPIPPEQLDGLITLAASSRE